MRDGIRRQADELFRQALELPDAARSRFLDETCERDSELRALVDRLLTASEEHCAPDDSDILSKPAPTHVAWRPDPELEPGAAIGAFRVKGTLGRGGMATVYLAERADGLVEQTVALKVLDARFLTVELVERFEQERQILATLNHPNIARLIDAGTLSDSRPYVIMEYIAGRSVEVYCDEEQLSVEARLLLFLKIVDAVQYAHRNLVVHRDIKPSNVLVTEGGEPKLLDFGIAKLLAANAMPHAAPETRDFLKPMTPEYGSPEQLSGQNVTTASDIYQLGCLLYLVLTGRRPYSTDWTSLAAVIEAICRTEAIAPSHAVRGGGKDTSKSEEHDDAPDDVAAMRGTTPRRLRRTLAGDLDNIVLRALNKEPERRYGTASELKDDIERYLTGRPVAARPASLRYTVGKFVDRHAVGLTLAACGVLVIVALTSFYTIRVIEERDRAEHEAEKAARVSAFMQSLFQDLAPDEMQGRTTTATELLENHVIDIGSELQDQPEIRAVLYRTVSSTYLEWGLYEQAEELAEQSVGLLTRVLGRDHPETLLSAKALVAAYHGRGKERQAELLAREIYPRTEVHFGADSREPLELLNLIGTTLLNQGRFQEAEQTLSDLIDRASGRSSEEDADLAIAGYLNLGTTYAYQSRFEDTVRVLSRGYALSREHYGEDHTTTLKFLNNLGRTREQQGHFDEAEQLYLQVIAARRRLLGDQHPATIGSRGNLGWLYHRMGRSQAAAAILDEAIADYSIALGPDHRRTVYLRGQRAILLQDEGRLQEAEQAFESILSSYASNREGDSLDALIARKDLAWVLAQQGAFEESERLYQQVLARFDADYPRNDFDRLFHLHSFGRMRIEQGRPGDAEPLLAETLARMREIEVQDRAFLARVMRDYGLCLSQLGKSIEAEPLLLEAYRIQQSLPSDRWEHASEETAGYLTELYAARGEQLPPL